MRRSIAKKLSFGVPLLLAGLVGAATLAVVSANVIPHSATPSVRTNADYSTLLRHVSSITIQTTTCQGSRDKYQVDVAPTVPADVVTSPKVASGDAAINLALATVSPGALTTTTEITAYPARITNGGGGFDTRVGTSINLRPMWVIEYSNLAILGGGKAPSATGPVHPGTFMIRSAMDFVDPATGLVAFTMLCP